MKTLERKVGENNNNVGAKFKRTYKGYRVGNLVDSGNIPGVGIIVAIHPRTETPFTVEYDGKLYFCRFEDISHCDD